MAVIDPAQLGARLDVDESGASFLENARRKAEAWVRHANLPALSDDSGLEVPALGGAPGVRSARFVDPAREATAAELIGALLQALGRLAATSPRALFRCAAVLALPDGRRFEGEGVLEGSIAGEPRGAGGFGYDPIFTLPDGRRLAELSLPEKNLLSHRARALAALEVKGAFDALIRGE